VTVKADSIVLGGIRDIEIGRESLFQDLCIVGPVGVVACVTVILLYRSMHIGSLLDLDPQLLVAYITYFLGTGFELPGVVGGMGSVTNRTLLLVKCSVLDLGIGQMLAHLLVTVEAQGLTIRKQHIWKIGGVGIVAPIAALGSWLVFIPELEL
jgi:hypothetical protein